MIGIMELFPLNDVQLKILSDTLEVAVVLLKAKAGEDPTVVTVPTLQHLCGSVVRRT
jgi:hypothetical protein